MNRYFENMDYRKVVAILIGMVIIISIFFITSISTTNNSIQSRKTGGDLNTMSPVVPTAVSFSSKFSYSTKSYFGNGIAFQYPSDWKILESNLKTTNGTILQIQSSDNNLLSVQISEDKTGKLKNTIENSMASRGYKKKYLAINSLLANQYEMIKNNRVERTTDFSAQGKLFIITEMYQATDNKARMLSDNLIASIRIP